MRLPFVISVPHGSFQVPEDIRSSMALTQMEILESTDLGAREVFTQLPVVAALWARWSRLVVDLNRDPEQRDARGVVPEVDYYGRDIYRGSCQPGEQEVESRLKKYYWPYHQRLEEALGRPEIRILFDCHSLTGIGPQGAPDPLKWRKDVVLGNNGNPKGDVERSRGTLTCPAQVLRMMKKVFDQFGFSVSVNQPYAGGFITTHYGRKLVETGKMAVQMEVNQDLFVESETLLLDRNRLADVATRLHHVFREVARRL